MKLLGYTLLNFMFIFLTWTIFTGKSKELKKRFLDEDDDEYSEEEFKVKQKEHKNKNLKAQQKEYKIPQRPKVEQKVKVEPKVKVESEVSKIFWLMLWNE